MRRLDCILESSKDAVLKAAKGSPSGVDDNDIAFRLSIANLIEPASADPVM
jgi:hypothetical protein